MWVLGVQSSGLGGVGHPSCCWGVVGSRLEGVVFGTAMLLSGCGGAEGACSPEGTGGMASSSSEAADGSSVGTSPDDGSGEGTSGGSSDPSDEGTTTGAEPPEPLPWTFELWVPDVDGVRVEFDDPAVEPIPLVDQGDGFWVAQVEAETLTPGARYRFVVRDSGVELELADPRALEVEGDRAVLHRQAWSWPSTEDDYVRPTRSEAIVYELHIGSFDRTRGPGTFQAAIERLDHLAQLGINVIEVMPVSEFPGESSWGYNPMFPFAVETAYGGPDGLARFVAEAHARDIAVILDVVYNHFDGSNVLCKLSTEPGCGAPYFSDDPTAWGPRPAFDELGVRDFLLDNVAVWIDTFHVDGYRWDSTSNIWASDNGAPPLLPGGRALLEEGNALIDVKSLDLLSVAEDFNGGAFVTAPRDDGGLGFDSQWDGGFHWAVTGALQAEFPSVQDVANSLRWRYGNDPFARVVYTENHDTTGYFNDHVRLPEQLDPNDSASYEVRKKVGLGLGLTLTAPGIPMLLQGQEFLQPGSFHDSHGLDWSLVQTQEGTLALTRDLIALRKNVEGHTPGLLGGAIETFHLNQGAGVLAFSRWGAQGKDDAVVVLVNFSPQPFESYRIGLPSSGTWTVRFDSDAERYGDDFGGQGSQATPADDQPRDGYPFSGQVALGAYSMVILSR